MTSANHLTVLENQAQSWAPQDVGVAVSDPTRPAPPVWPQEALTIARAVPARRREFAAGRDAARRAMNALGLDAQAVPGGANRAPQWPVGLTGTISHDATSCVAMVALSGQFRGLGVDVEPDAPLPEDLLPEICVPAERAWLEAQPANERYRLARRIFCAKEAVYKAQFPVTRLLFGFDAVEVQLNAQDNRFVATFRHHIGAIRAGNVVSGRVGAVAGHVLAVVALGAQAGSQNADFPVSAIG
ncbi:4'-phosphopantetheinyl transferase family protein [Shimia abyssi]|nr:4'-phosphopantetheinyl transferase superfamily protein [Shimia abyssi]